VLDLPLKSKVEAGSKHLDAKAGNLAQKLFAWLAAFLPDGLTSRLLPKFGPLEVSNAPVRLHEIDGLRGWAALVVVCFHFFWETFGVVIPSIHNPWTTVFLDGRLAVSVFFVLSGSALSSSYFAGKGRRAVIQLLVKRYPRLTIPILVTALIVAGLVACGLTANAEAARIVHRDWLGGFLRDPISLSDVLKYSLAAVYLHPASHIIPMLWTMTIEMSGSLLVFGLLLFLYNSRFGWNVIATATFAMLIGGSFQLIHHAFLQYACFLSGVMFAGMRSAGLFQRAHASIKIQTLTWAVIAAVIAVEAARNDGSGNDLYGFELIEAPIAIVLVLAVFCNRSCSDFFANGLSRRLGDLSFPLYLLQFPVLVSFTSLCIVYAGHHASLTPATAIVIGILSVAACFAAAIAFQPVETLTRRVGSMLVRCLPETVRFPATADKAAIPGASGKVGLASSRS
jgi:peptidoglycan/LPS O-acetylase OafA/YrhL